MPKADASTQPGGAGHAGGADPPHADGTVSNNGARQVFDALWTGEAADVDAADRGQGPEADERQRRARSHRRREVLAANPKSVDEFRAGKDKAFNALVGQVMKASKGKANPAQAGELLRRRLG
jgi:aspartyl-tRNA(Asn)/glutamyl-tRNA(Gln) amidotransferase subunit B